MQNPFTLTFGRSPLESVERPVQINEILEAFTADTVNQQMFIITGVRGSGKTVMMTQISNKLRADADWVVIELNPATDLLSSMENAIRDGNEKEIENFFASAKEYRDQLFPAQPDNAK